MNGLRAQAAAFWWHRERVEVEAASLFVTLAKNLEVTGPPAIARLADKAAKDELRHADQCRALVDRFRGTVSFDPVPRRSVPIQLRPRCDTLTRHQAALYSAVAVGCITESLSAALLLQIRKHATDDLAAQTAHDILRDEIDHSRVGWAMLASEASRGDLSWLSPHIPAMLKAAIKEESAESNGSFTGALMPFGVLSPSLVKETCDATVRDVIIPGFLHYGIAFDH